jgi:hypothetical protein
LTEKDDEDAGSANKFRQWAGREHARHASTHNAGLAALVREEIDVRM